MPSKSFSASQSVGDCSFINSMRTTVPDGHWTSFGMTIIPSSTLAVMLITRGNYQTFVHVAIFVQWHQ